jgi:hypothetical protein
LLIDIDDDDDDEKEEEEEEVGKLQGGFIQGRIHARLQRF